MVGKWSPFDVTPFLEHEKTQDVRNNLYNKIIINNILMIIFLGR